jgi:hypothetical protein
VQKIFLPSANMIPQPRSVDIKPIAINAMPPASSISKGAAARSITLTWRFTSSRILPYGWKSGMEGDALKVANKPLIQDLVFGSKRTYGSFSLSGKMTILPAQEIAEVKLYWRWFFYDQYIPVGKQKGNVFHALSNKSGRNLTMGVVN